MLKQWAEQIKRDGVTLWFAAKQPGTPWYAKALGVFVVAYAFNPIDLIPDFIPVLGYLDDLVLLPGLIWFAIKLLPPDVLADCHSQTDTWKKSQGQKPSSRIGAMVIIDHVAVDCGQRCTLDLGFLALATADKHQHFNRG